jgi:hypothetical protein
MTQLGRSDVDAHNHAIEIPVPDVVRELVAFLGAPAVALLADVKETRAVQQWMDGRQPQNPHVLRFALQIASMLAAVGDKTVAQAWFHGSNPTLGGKSPLALFRTEPLSEIQVPLLTAARVFSEREEIA